ncbi:hypothetical protein Bpfe_000331 [Biomphalaria pfeifferi]|uniref:Uncharacterized protein n=1 Tax=Biomphalaria pfeifferi TaxID=112525 RepID=A0AAD8CCT9_BIOPF|nr:hypothetical protein Bpfe_000331 [Biomphalaria pfeifferi]
MTEQKSGSNQLVGSPGRQANTSSPDFSANLKPLHPGIDTARKSRGEPNPCSRGLTSLHGSSATIQDQSSPGIDRVRKSRCKPNYCTRGDVLHQDSTSFTRPLFPGIDSVRRNRGKPIIYSREEVLTAASEVSPNEHTCLGRSA